MSGEAILVIDDNPLNLELLRVLLGAERYEIRYALDAEEALLILQSFHPRLILMDMQLPGMDGFELTRRLKADVATRDIVIFAVTSYAMKRDEQRAFDAGCDGYISKPIDTQTLPGLIAEQVRLRRGGDPG